jgi:hypothetical protein
MAKGEFFKSVAVAPGGEVRFTVSRWNGTTRLDIRYYFQHGTTGKWTATQRGVIVPLRKINEVQEIIDEITRLDAKREFGDVHHSDDSGRGGEG